MIFFGNQQNRVTFNPDTVTIGTQVWTLQNLAVNELPGGITIPIVTDASAWAALTTPGCCWYLNDQATYGAYGMLYNWYAVASINAAYNSLGWKVATDAEWTTLTIYLGGTSVAGGKMKETGYTHWNSPNTGATNSSGYTALGTGYRSNGGIFANNKVWNFIWTSTQDSSINGYLYWLTNSLNSISRISRDKHSGYSIRLLKI